MVTKCDSAKAQILLGTLPDYYKMVVNNIASQTENPTYHGVTVQLRDLITKNPKTAKNTESTLTNPTAFTIQSTKAEQTCDYCRKKKGWSGRGHIEAECRTKRREAQSNHQAHIAATENNDEYCDWAFVTHTSTSANSMDWEYDSGCTVHITPHLNLLHQAEPHQIQVRGISGSTWSMLHPKYYRSDIWIRTGQEGIGNSSHGLRTAYRDRATDSVGARLGSTDSAAPGNPWAKYRTDRESASAAAEEDNLGGHHKQDKRSEGKRERMELRV